jgi:hypothetical protein
VRAGVVVPLFNVFSRSLQRTARVLRLGRLIIHKDKGNTYGTLARGHAREHGRRECSLGVRVRLLTAYVKPNAQEDELLYHIDQLTLRGLPPTPEMLKNLVEEITKQPIGERLIWRFRQHHANRIDSLQTRKVADNSKYFEHFIEENIKSAFESTGIHLIDSQKVLSQVGRRTPSPISSDREPEETTPMSVRGVRRAVKAVGREHKVLDPKISKLIKATERLVIRNEILEHNNKNLNQALCTEKKRRKRGKPMGLVDKDNPGEAQFFSPSKVASARQRALEIDQEKEQQQAEAAQRRLEKQIQREEKARELKERKEERLRAREMKRQEQETRKREKEEERQKKKADKQLSREQQAKEKRGNTRKRQEKGNQTVETESSPTRPEPRVTASGRKIRPPGRYLD